MAMTAESTAVIVEKYKQTSRITYLTAHLQSHEKDHAARRGLLKLVGRRRRLLKYINKKDAARYSALIKNLELRR
jgi:small subunit ribosomal protein S15